MIPHKLNRMINTEL